MENMHTDVTVLRIINDFTFNVHLHGYQGRKIWGGEGIKAPSTHFGGTVTPYKHPAKNRVTWHRKKKLSSPNKREIKKE